AMNGGLTPTMLPGPTSVALNMGNPTDFSDAQNGPIYGRRDIGAAERPVISYDTTSACIPVSWWGNTYSTAGTYLDTAYNANSIDSVGVLVLELQDTSVFDLDGTLYASEQDTNTTYQWVDCDNNYAVIVGATSRGFLPPANGNYAVILTNQNCVDTSSCISYNRFSISERSTTEDWLTFYPNPTSGVIHYSFTGNAPMQVEVLDLSGRNVTTFELDGETTLQLPSLANGTYLLRWMGSQGEVQVDRICVVE
ncbi:MAG: T9SS type A sorting domain-containing protein, partial [Bacteroidetes bacterium]